MQLKEERDKAMEAKGALGRAVGIRNKKPRQDDVRSVLRSNKPKKLMRMNRRVLDSSSDEEDGNENDNGTPKRTAQKPASRRRVQDDDEESSDEEEEQQKKRKEKGSRGNKDQGDFYISLLILLEI